ncbi:MAG TPA: ABC transporter permease subunit [Taishania sp.]|nr:ABC transporter permease subunit [Taishania sp.]
MIFTVFKKELLETIRDRRTIIAMMIIPALLFPLIFKLTSSMTRNMAEETASKTLQVAYVGEGNDLMKFLKEDNNESLGKFSYIQYKDTTLIRKGIQDGKIHLGIYFDQDYSENYKHKKVAKIHIFHDATNLGYKERLTEKIDLFDKQTTEERLNKLGLSKDVLNTFSIEEINTATSQQMIGKLAGGMLPYIFIIFGFIGCMYPAIDLFTGEKERGTVETLLTTPVPRWKILTGKMGVVVLSGIMAAAFSIGGLYYAAKDLPTGGQFSELSIVLDSLFNSQTLTSMFILVLPLIIFFAGVMIPISVYAKSFKEAQSIITPLNILVLVPAMIGMYPGIEYNMSTAFIPVLNVVLATKEIIAGTIDHTLYSMTLLSLISIAVIAILISHKQFGKESNISSN